MAGYQTSTVSGISGTYTVQSYNAANAALANMMVTNQLLEMDRRMEMDKKAHDAGYLKRNTIHPGQTIFGYMMVKKQRGKTMTVYIHVNNVPFIFNWNLKK